MNKKLYKLSLEKADGKRGCNLRSSESDDWPHRFDNFLFMSAQFY